MKKVNIYTYGTVKGPRRRDGSFTWILEFVTAKGPATLTHHGTMEQVSENGMQVRMFVEAAEKLTEPCELTLYTESCSMKNAVENRVRIWQENGWKNTRGKNIEDREVWEKAAALLALHHVTVLDGQPHEYREWLKNETGKREKERREAEENAQTCINTHADEEAKF